jgi:YHS domain-containing protein
MNRRHTFALIAVAAMLSPAWAAEPEIYTGLVDGVGAGGYDVVSYFSGTPVEGKAEFASEWKGAKWYFSSAENMKMFSEAPEKFAPQYGGYCAYAVAKGSTASADPQAWTVHDGKLYLNYSKSIRSTWEKDIPGHVMKADANWPKVLE